MMNECSTFTKKKQKIKFYEATIAKKIKKNEAFLKSLLKSNIDLEDKIKIKNLLKNNKNLI